MAPSFPAVDQRRGSTSNARSAASSAPYLRSPSPRSRAGSGSTQLRSIPRPTTAHVGFWHASGRTTSPRFTRLREALAIARTTPHPPEVHRGDIVDDLAAVADRIAPSGPLIVFHSWVAAYLSAQRQRELVAAVRGLARERTVHYLYAEASAETPGLPTPPSPSPRPTSHLATALVYLAPDGSPPVRLADMHHHGKWLQWWPTPTDPTVRPDEPEPAPPRR